jgi:dUTPase
MNEIPMLCNQNTMVLSMYIDSQDEEFIEKYKEHIEKHNHKLRNNREFTDAGFDLLSPLEYSLTGTSKQLKINYQIKCRALMCSINRGEDQRTFHTGYYIYPRSSISKTSFRLANGTGIIDSGYRGNLIGMFDVIDCDCDCDGKIDKYDRLVQICAPNLCPIFVELVTLEELGETSRGEGGFGSTGK